MKVVLIGDETQTADVVGLSFRLRWPNAKLLVAATAAAGLESVENISPDVVLIHPSFTDMSLAGTIQELRGFSNVPMLVLGSQGSETEIITALELGADDYIRLPCDLPEIMARVWALLRRSGAIERPEEEKPRWVRSTCNGRTHRGVYKPGYSIRAPTGATPPTGWRTAYAGQQRRPPG